MEITWFGQSCFLIRSRANKKILTDPFDEAIGYSLPKEPVDLITVSHSHFDHDNVKPFGETPIVINSDGIFKNDITTVEGIKSFHDDCQGAKRGPNIIFKFAIDGFTLCHLGDLGEIPNEQLLSQIGNINILLIPVGGNYTIDGNDAARVCKLINSNIVIPMHFGTKALTFQLEGLEKFIVKMKNAERINSSTLIIDSLPSASNYVKILDYQQ